MSLRSFLHVFAVIAITLTLVPFIAVDYWWIRMFDFPHIQLTILTFTAFVVYFMRFQIRHAPDYIFAIALGACLLYQLSKLYPYTGLAPFEVLEAKDVTAARSISLYTANVLQDNDNHQGLIDDFAKKDPDILLFLETDEKWMNAIESQLPSSYTERVKIPLDNTYGMLLYSKLQLLDTRALFMVKQDIPSIHSKVLLRSGDTVQLYTIHPTPPMPQHNPSSSDRDAEMMKIAKLSGESKTPVIVLGDFNDVAWSQTTGLFQNVGQLLDIRKGRGFYNTYNAQNPVLRWPLDHVFVSAEFRAISIELGADFGSDHYPTFAVLHFEPENAQAQRPPEPTPEQLENANEQASRVKELQIEF